MGIQVTTTNLSYARNEYIGVGHSFIFDKVADMIYYIMTNDDISTTSTSTLTVGADGAGEDVKFYGDTSGALFEWDADDNRLELTNSRYQVLTTDDKTAAFNAIYSYIDTGGATGWTAGNVVAGRFKLNIDGTSSAGDATALWAGLVWAGNVARNGLAVAMNVELATTATNNAPNAILYIQSLPGTNASHAGLPYIVFTETATGTGSNVLFECGHVPAGTTVTSGAGKLFNTTTLQIKVNGTTKYIPLSTTENTVTTAGNVALTGTLTTGVNGTGVDVVFYGDTTGANMTWDQDDDRLELTNSFLQLGVQGTGIPITDTIKYALEVHTKPGIDMASTGLVAGIRSRFEVSTAQTNQVTFCAIDARMRPKANMADGVISGLQATIETDALTFSGTSTTQRNAGTFTLDFAASTVISSGWLCGIAIDSSMNSATDLSSCTCAALRINTGSSKEPWTYGIYLTGAEKPFYSTATMTGAAAANAMHLVVTDQIAIASTSYTRGLYINYTNAGTKSANAEVNGIGVDINATSNVTSVYGISIYTAAMTSATVNRVAGIYIYVDEDAGTVDTASCIHLENANTGATQSDFISFRSHVDTVDSIFASRSGGQTATYLWYFEPPTSAPVEAFGSAGNGDYSIKCRINGETTYIHTYDAA